MYIAMDSFASTVIANLYYNIFRCGYSNVLDSDWTGFPNLHLTLNRFV